MSVKGLRDAFNEVMGPAGKCQMALLDYVRQGGTEWQILVFSGTYADGSGFSIKSDRLRPVTDVFQAARETAAQLLAQRAKT
jgi:hypothetical protein